MRARAGRAEGVLTLVGLTVLVVGCHAVWMSDRSSRTEGVSVQVARGAVLYGAYCAGCHGHDGREDGPLALFLDIYPPDLRAEGLLTDVSDAELLERLRAGTPLSAATPGDLSLDEHRVDQLEAYLMSLGAQDWSLLRAGRVVFGADCASCHGVYGDGDGDGDGVYPALPRSQPPDLAQARERYTDEELAAVSVEGTGTMPPLVGGFEPMEMRALVAYVRHLSPGYRLYETYCALCHGDDGQGVHPEDLRAPGTAAPPLSAARLARLGERERRARVLHMLRREQGVMPHFRGLVDDGELRDVVAYLRSWER